MLYNYNNYYHSLIARWGHCQEGYGEDPYLQAELGMQLFRTVQILLTLRQ